MVVRHKQPYRGRSLRGKRFGVLTVVSSVPTQVSPQKWRVECICGVRREAFYTNLVQNPAQRCMHQPARLPGNGPKPRLHAIAGEVTTITDYAEKHGVKPMTLYQRKKRGVLAREPRRLPNPWAHALGALVIYTPEGGSASRFPWRVIGRLWGQHLEKSDDLYYTIVPAPGTPQVQGHGPAVVLPPQLAPWPLPDEEAAHAV